jgi:hypothetical protein
MLDDRAGSPRTGRCPATAGPLGRFHTAHKLTRETCVFLHVSRHSPQPAPDPRSGHYTEMGSPDSFCSPKLPGRSQDDLYFRFYWLTA